MATMSLGDWFNAAIGLQMFFAALCYAADKNWPKVLYFLCGAGIALSVHLMEK